MSVDGWSNWDTKEAHDILMSEDRDLESMDSDELTDWMENTAASVIRDFYSDRAIPRSEQVNFEDVDWEEIADTILGD